MFSTNSVKSPYFFSNTSYNTTPYHPVNIYISSNQILSHTMLAQALCHPMELIFKRLSSIDNIIQHILPLSETTPPAPAFSLVESRGISETLSTGI